MRENAWTKADRLLTHGRVVVRSVTSHGVVADVRGDSGVVHIVTGDEDRWTCSCPAVAHCSHAIAVARVTLRPFTLTGTGPAGITERTER